MKRCVKKPHAVVSHTIIGGAAGLRSRKMVWMKKVEVNTKGYEKMKIPAKERERESAWTTGQVAEIDR